MWGVIEYKSVFFSNKHIQGKLFYVIIVAFVLIILSIISCTKKKPTSKNPGDRSSKTGTAYNKGGFELEEFRGQPICPGLVYIEGGKATLGVIKEDFLYENDNFERTVTVQSFYMDETEVANVHWHEYLFYVRIDSTEETYLAALPDTTVWARALSYNDAFVDHYFRHPGFRFYPVVGVSWKQVISFCEWRTSVVQRVLNGEQLLRPRGKGPTFTFGDTIKNRYKPENFKDKTNRTIPNYRLPTEDEWEYAACAVIDLWNRDENSQKRLYPWDGTSLRNPYNKSKAIFLANFKRGRGDYAGIAGALNDGAIITDYVYAYPPNDFGLYNMAGNVSEWVYDKYKPRDFELIGIKTDDDNLGGKKSEESEEEYTLLGSNVRVYKGGSWKDIAFWLAPGARRYLEEDSSTATIGFRCAMDKLGSKDK
jgi:gliding motility-associated lipoprotein GldJ